MNEASQWRMALARHIAVPYIANPNVAAVIVGGSTSRGHADRYSDIELGAFWHKPPTDAERQAAAEATGAHIQRLYPYDVEEEVWEDDLFAGYLSSDQPTTGVLVEIPHYTVEFMERVLADVLVHHDPSEAKQNLLAALTWAIPLKGAALVEEWQAQAAVYPGELAVAIVKKHAQIDHFWRAELFLERGNNLVLLYDSFVQVAKKLLHIIFALNRTYYSGFKWTHLQLAGMPIAPPDFDRRLRQVFQLEPPDATREMRLLVEETYNLIEKAMPEVDIERLRLIFRYRRQPWDVPPEGAC